MTIAPEHEIGDLQRLWELGKNLDVIDAGTSGNGPVMLEMLQRLDAALLLTDNETMRRNRDRVAQCIELFTPPDGSAAAMLTATLAKKLKG